MNNVREVNRINERELDLAVEGRASWHDDFRDSAYIFVGNLDKRLTEGDVIAIFSQYGELLDINLPRVGLRDAAEKRGQDTGAETKPGDRKGFGFLLYEDQRSTILAVDNLNGFVLLGRTIRVDHVRDYKMPRRMNEDGQVLEAEAPSRNAAPQVVQARPSPSPKAAEDDDAEDPMAAYIARSKRSGGDDDKEERRRRKEERRRKREARELRREHHSHRRRRDSDSPPQRRV